MDLTVMEMELARERAESARREGDYRSYRLAVGEISRCEQIIAKRLDQMVADNA